MGAERHDHNQPHQWVAALPLIAPTGVAPRVLATEVVSILNAVGNAQRRAVGAIQRQTSPAISASASMRPLLGGPQVQPFHWIWPEPCSRLADRTARDRPASVRGWQCNVELARD